MKLFIQIWLRHRGLVILFMEKQMATGQIDDMSEMHDLIVQNIHNCHQIRFESVEGIGELENHQLEDYDSEPEEEKINCLKNIYLTRQTKSITMDEIKSTIRNEMLIQFNKVWNSKYWANFFKR